MVEETNIFPNNKIRLRSSSLFGNTVHILNTRNLPFSSRAACLWSTVPPQSVFSQALPRTRNTDITKDVYSPSSLPAHSKSSINKPTHWPGCTSRKIRQTAEMNNTENRITYFVLEAKATSLHPLS